MRVSQAMSSGRKSVDLEMAVHNTYRHLLHKECLESTFGRLPRTSEHSRRWIGPDDESDGTEDYCQDPKLRCPRCPKCHQLDQSCEVPTLRKPYCNPVRSVYLDTDILGQDEVVPLNVAVPGGAVQKLNLAHTSHRLGIALKDLQDRFKDMEEEEELIGTDIVEQAENTRELLVKHITKMLRQRANSALEVGLLAIVDQVERAI